MIILFIIFVMMMIAFKELSYVGKKDKMWKRVTEVEKKLTHIVYKEHMSVPIVENNIREIKKELQFIKHYTATFMKEDDKKYFDEIIEVVEERLSRLKLPTL